MQERIRLLAVGVDVGLDIVDDLRKLNTGRPTEFDTYFGHMEEEVESVIAADERRHGEAHFSEWISLENLWKNTAKRCPPGTRIPSMDLVRLQLTPRNKYCHAALNFTSKIPIQYKIQVRQLRAQHEDQYYCATQFLYLR